MKVETFTVGLLYTNCYVASCPTVKEAIIIDPGLEFATEANPINNYITHESLKIKYIVNTHGHNDHIKGDRLFQQKYNVPVCIHRLDEIFLEDFTPSVPNVLLEEGSAIMFGGETLSVLHTPGHTPGCICLLGKKLVFTGDTLFAGSIGRTDFPEGSVKDMQVSLQKLKKLPDHLLVYAGHGETSLMTREKRVNPFFKEENWGFMF